MKGKKDPKQNRKPNPAPEPKPNNEEPPRRAEVDSKP